MKWFAAVLFTLANLALAGRAFGADDATIQKGQKVYEYWCATCHGPGLPGTVALETKYKGAKPALLIERTDLNAAERKVISLVYPVSVAGLK